jgi:hypothetical protein
MSRALHCTFGQAENFLLCITAWYLLHAGFLLGLFFDPEHGGDILLGNVGWLSADHTPLYVNRDSIVSIATGYGLGDRGVRVRVPVGSNIFSSPRRLQTGSGAHPASYPMGTRGALSPGVKWPEPPPASAEVKKMWLDTSTPPYDFMA